MHWKHSFSNVNRAIVVAVFVAIWIVKESQSLDIQSLCKLELDNCGRPLQYFPIDIMQLQFLLYQHTSHKQTTLIRKIAFCGEIEIVAWIQE